MLARRLQSIKEKSHFFLLRLKASSIAELWYRARQNLDMMAAERTLKKGGKITQMPEEVGMESIYSLILPSFELHGAIPDREGFFSPTAETIASSNFEESCRQSFSMRIRPRDTEMDVRSVWEPARLQDVSLRIVSAPQHQNTPDVKSQIKYAVLHWISDNPFLLGPHYQSAMECGLRIPVFFYCLRFLDNLSDNEQQVILNAVYLHAWWISRRLSLYSSLGNHTICECLGLIFAGAIFKETKQGRAWLGTGIGLLKSELTHQILDDGGSAEQSLNYHRFILDQYWLALDFLESNHLCDCSEWKPRLVQGERFLKSFQINNGSFPSIGDSDDGYAIAPGRSPKRSIPEPKAQDFTVFRQSGYTVAKSGDSVFLTFDHGPLGMPPLYNHGHADALSVTFSRNGLILLVDSGTFRYNGAPEWRKYFKGTRAHNTVTIDGVDQAVQETGFIWSHPYKTNLLRAERTKAGWVIEAEHSGYTRLRNPVWHRRSIVGIDGEIILIRDTFTGKGIHTYELNYHVHPDASVKRSDGWWVLERGGTISFITLLEGADFSLVKGQTDPILGWYSPSYGIKQETSVLTCARVGGATQVSFITAISTKGAMSHGLLLERMEKRAW